MSMHPNTGESTTVVWSMAVCPWWICTMFTMLSPGCTVLFTWTVRVSCSWPPAGMVRLFQMMSGSWYTPPLEEETYVVW